MHTESVVELTAEQTATLRCGPLWVATAVLGTYRLNELERDAFWSSVIDTARESHGRTRQILALLAAEREAVMQQHQDSPMSAAAGLRRVVDTLRDFDGFAATNFKRALLSIGWRIAKVRGFGRGVTHEDMQTLTVVAVLLDLTFSDVSQP